MTGPWLSIGGWPQPALHRLISPLQLPADPLMPSHKVLSRQVPCSQLPLYSETPFIQPLRIPGPPPTPGGSPCTSGLPTFIPASHLPHPLHPPASCTTQPYIPPTPQPSAPQPYPAHRLPDGRRHAEPGAVVLRYAEPVAAEVVPGLGGEGIGKEPHVPREHGIQRLGPLHVRAPGRRHLAAGAFPPARIGPLGPPARSYWAAALPLRNGGEEPPVAHLWSKGRLGLPWGCHGAVAG